MAQFSPDFDVIFGKLICQLHIDRPYEAIVPSDGSPQTHGPSEAHGPPGGPLNSMGPGVIVPLCPPLGGPAKYHYLL